jgi:succinate dehydrogenase flavin-adding protein (antitoxin of CptAB toxin-antitoxin module)
MAPRDHPTIDAVLGEFLAEQREHLSARTFRDYDEVVELLRHSLDGYAYSALDDDERRRWEQALESEDEGTFCRLFGPEKIPGHLGEFLGYFMVRKVMAGQELLRASGTVTGKLVTWLAARGYIDRDSADDATGRAKVAARDLPVADRLGGLLHDVAARAPEIDMDAVDDKDWVEDHLAISDVEPGRIWFEGGIGPIAVPREASDLARPGWSAFVTAARTADSWHLLEVGFVYP